MHTEKCVGKFVDVQFDDAAKNIPVCAHVSDDDEWAAVKNGERTGFSMGGRYGKRWPDQPTGGVRFSVGKVAEGSTVDNPCMYGATFQAIKADGGQELRKFHDAATVAKGMYSVQVLSDIVDRLDALTRSAEYEAEIEGDASPIPAALAAVRASAGAALIAMTTEEVDEMTSRQEGDAMTQAETATDLKKSDTPVEEETKVSELPVDDKPKDDVTDPPKDAAAVPPAAATEATIESAVKAYVAPYLERLEKATFLLENVRPPAATIDKVDAPEAVLKGDLEKIAKAEDVANLAKVLDRIEGLLKALPAPPAGRAIRKQIGEIGSPQGMDMEAYGKFAEDLIAKAQTAGQPKAVLDAMRLALAEQAFKSV
jgi:hypothetical protein